MNYGKEFTKGLIRENPTLVSLLGMCPTLAVTTGAFNGIGMGLSTAFVLIFSNLVISLLRKVIPEQVKLPCYIVIIATFVTLIQFLLHGFVPALYTNLGAFLELITVNSGRASDGSLHPVHLQRTGNLYPVDCCKLYYFRTGGNVRQQEHPTAVYLRWCWHGIGLYTRPVPDGLDSGNLRFWQLVRAVHSVHAGTHHVTVRHAGRRFLCPWHYHCRCLPSFQEKATKKNRMQCLPECGCLPGCKL